MEDDNLKPLEFIGSALKDLRAFPKAVRDDVGFDLYQVQCGLTPSSAKSLKGLSGVMELVERYDTNTYRVVYIANLGGAIYVLHCFKKKSKRDMQTPKENMDLIRRRYREAKELAEEN